MGSIGHLRPVGAVPSSNPPQPAPQWSAPVAGCRFGFRTERGVFLPLVVATRGPGFDHYS